MIFREILMVIWNVLYYSNIRYHHFFEYILLFRGGSRVVPHRYLVFVRLLEKISFYYFIFAEFSRVEIISWFRRCFIDLTVGAPVSCFSLIRPWLFLFNDQDDKKRLIRVSALSCLCGIFATKFHDTKYIPNTLSTQSHSKYQTFD